VGVKIERLGFATDRVAGSSLEIVPEEIDLAWLLAGHLAELVGPELLVRRLGYSP
jgi:hypothetical protein